MVKVKKKQHKSFYLTILRTGVGDSFQQRSDRYNDAAIFVSEKVKR